MATIRLRPLVQEAPPHPRLAALPFYPWLVVGTVCVGAFLGQLDASIAQLVLPTLEDVFQVPVSAVEWVAIAYLVALAALVVPFGRLADLAGRKTQYTLGFLVFILGSGLCGFAPNLSVLIAFRVVQAIGAAMLQANSIAIVTAAVQPCQRGRALGIQGAAQAVGLSIGPSLGGLLIDTLGWRWVFFIAVPFGLLGTVLGWLVLPRTRPLAVVHASQEKERFDWPGVALFTPSICALLLVLSYAGDWGITSARTQLLAVVTVLLFVAFVVVERRTVAPLVDPLVLRIPSVALGMSASLLTFTVLFGTLFLVPFYLERTLNMSPAETGLLLTPAPLGLGVAAPLSGIISDRLGDRLPRMFGTALAGLALGALALDATSSLPLILVVLALVGIGVGCFNAPNGSAVMGSVPASRLGIASGLLNMVRSLGTSLGVAATGLVLTLILGAEVGHAVTGTTDVPADALGLAIHHTLLFLTVLALIASALVGAEGLFASSPSEGLRVRIVGDEVVAETGPEAGTGAPARGETTAG